MMRVGQTDAVADLVGSILIYPTESFYFEASEAHRSPSVLLTAQVEFEEVRQIFLG